MASLTGSTPRVRVFIAGGSYAGLSCALNLSDLNERIQPRMARGANYDFHPELPSIQYDITIADERDGFLHLIGCPLALADAEYSKKAWVKFQHVPALQQRPNIRMVHGSVSSIDPEAKQATVLDHATKEAATYDYDFFVAASGLRRAWPVVPQSLTRKQYLIEAGEHIHSVANTRDGVIVVGGGAVGIEMAAELKFVKPHVKVTLVHSRDRLLSSESLPDETKDKALEVLQKTGVEVLLNTRLATSNKVETGDGAPRYEVEFTNGQRMVASEVVMAVSRPQPTTSYLPSSALDEEGYVKIRTSLHLPGDTPNASAHFCGGDATRWPGIKRCGGAMHHGHYIARNIHQTVTKQVFPEYEPEFMELVPYPSVIGLAVGKEAVAYSPDSGTISGEDVAQAYFGGDLGFTVIWNYMGLGGAKVEVQAA